MSIVSGEEIGSVKNRGESPVPVSFICHNVVIAKILMRRLCAVVLINRVLSGDSQVSGSSINEGMIIFSIVGGLDFVRSLCHMCLKSLLVRLDLLLLRMLRIQGLRWELRM